MVQLANTATASTVERSVIILAIANGCEILNSEYDPALGRTVFYFNEKQLSDVILQMTSNKPIQIDFRKVMAAENLFNTAVHNGRKK